MTEQELRDKIVNIAISTVWKDCYGDEVVIDRAVAKQFADALIAAGLKFDVNYSFTAAFNNAQAERERDLERRLTAAEHRAEVAERAARDLIAYYCGYTIQSDIDNSLRVALQQAEKELAEERKEC